MVCNTFPSLHFHFIYIVISLFFPLFLLFSFLPFYTPSLTLYLLLVVVFFSHIRFSIIIFATNTAFAYYKLNCFIATIWADVATIATRLSHKFTQKCLSQKTQQKEMHAFVYASVYVCLMDSDSLCAHKKRKNSYCWQYCIQNPTLPLRTLCILHHFYLIFFHFIYYININCRIIIYVLRLALSPFSYYLTRPSH